MPHDDRPKGHGRPFREVFPSEFGAKASTEDQWEVALQTSRLGPDVSESGWQTGLIDELQERRKVGADFSRTSFEIPISVIRAREKVVLSADYILVRTADYLGRAPARHKETMKDVLAKFLYTAELADSPHAPEADLQPAEQGELQGRLTMLSFKGMTGADLLPIVERLHRKGFAASLDHIVPLANGVILKGKGAIKMTTRSVAFPPPWAAAGTPVVVAVVDTGIQTSHRVDGWLDNVEDSRNVDPLDAYPLAPGPDGFLDLGAGHGTFVAGIVQQVSPTTTVRMYRAIDSDGIGSEVAVAIAIVRAAREGASIVNLSLGTVTIDNRPPLALSTAMDILAERFPEVVVVAAAGNTGSNTESWPSAFADVVSVAALDADLARSPWSDNGDWVDFCTVGQGVLSTYVPGTEAPDGGVPGDTFDDRHLWGLGTGTSFAAPQISGAIARLLQTGRSVSARDAVVYLKTLALDRHDGYGVPLQILPGTAV